MTPEGKEVSWEKERPSGTVDNPRCEVATEMPDVFVSKDTPEEGRVEPQAGLS